MKILSVLALVGVASVISACSSSDSGEADGTASGTTTSNGATTNGTASAGTATDGTATDGAAGTTAGTATAGTATATAGTSTSGTSDGSGTTPPDTSTSLLDAGLSHSGTAVASVAETPNDPLIKTDGQARVATLANSPAVIFQVAGNQGTAEGLDCTSLGAQYNSCSIVNLHINDANGALDDNAWKLFFHSTRRILEVSSNEFSVTHVNGDLHYLAPNDQFSGFGGAAKSVKMVTEFNHLVETDFQPRYWIARGGDALLIANTDEETDESRYAMDITGNDRFEFVGENNAIATPEVRFDRNAGLAATAASVSASAIAGRIIPKPSSIVQSNAVLDIGAGFSFASMDLPAASISALQSRQALFMSTSAGVPLQSSIDASMPANTYSLSVASTGISISASDETMLFYAAQSLLALVQPGVGTIPQVEITDSPRFGFRGMHVDVARNFHSVDSMKKLMDQMSAYKLNKLHMHLSDDEGWRLEIPSLPELSSVGGKREFSVDENGNVTETQSLMPAMGSGPNSNNQGTGFYSRAQFIDLLNYANARFIEVIPEFDMPAHARAAVVAMRARARNSGDARSIDVRIDDPDDTSRYLTVQNYNDSFINPCVPGTYNFLTTVINDVKAMYTEAGLPLNVWHMGGDEAVNILLGFGFPNPDTSLYDQPWAKSPVCTDFISNTAGVNSRDELTPYFIQQVAQIVGDAGIPFLYAYQDIYGDLTASDLNTTGAGVDFWAPLSNANPSNSTNTIASANSFSNRGFETVIGVPDYLYFDFPYEVDPKERGYYWATRQTNTEKVFKFAPENLAQNAETSVERYGNPWSATNQGSNQGFAGMQGYLWSETVRTPEHFDYMLFPRLLALAERAWHEASWELPYVSGTTFSSTSGQVDTNAVEAGYAEFASTIGAKEMLKLDAANVNYRIPPPGAKNVGGVVQMNTNFPGLALEYSTDGNNWQTWNSAAPPAAATFFRSRSANGNRTSRVTQ